MWKSCSFSCFKFLHIQATSPPPRPLRWKALDCSQVYCTVHTAPHFSLFVVACWFAVAGCWIFTFLSFHLFTKVELSTVEFCCVEFYSCSVGLIHCYCKELSSDGSNHIEEVYIQKGRQRPWLQYVASAARNWINSVPQAARTTFVFFFGIYLLLLCSRNLSSFFLI